MPKTKNQSIRFEVADWDFITKRQGFKTAQQVVNFLVSEYMKLYKVDNPSIFIAEKEISYNGGNENEIYEVSCWSEPKKETKLVRSFENYRQLKVECENEEDWIKLKEEIQNAQNLSIKQKVLLTN